MTRITDRIERELGVPGLAALLAERVEPTDLQSLLLEVYRLSAARKDAPALLSEYEANRFARASAASPLRLLEWDRVALAQLPPECEAIELSPLCPLGTCSVVAGASQDWSVPTARNTEVVSDSTNVLALEAALRRRRLLRGDPRSQQAVHLAASQRVLRAQRYQDPRLMPHFRLLALCSAGRDAGGFRFEAGALALHICFYLAALRAYLAQPVPLRVSITIFGPASGFTAATDELFSGVQAQFERVECVLDPERESRRGYYAGLCFHVHAQTLSGQWLELADGGAVDWTQRLLSNAKERLVISGIGSERVCALRDEGDAAPRTGSD